MSKGRGWHGDSAGHRRAAKKRGLLGVDNRLAIIAKNKQDRARTKLRKERSKASLGRVVKKLRSHFRSQGSSKHGAAKLAKQTYLLGKPNRRW